MHYKGAVRSQLVGVDKEICCINPGTPTKGLQLLSAAKTARLLAGRQLKKRPKSIIEPEE